MQTSKARLESTVLISAAPRNKLEDLIGSLSAAIEVTGVDYQQIPGTAHFRAIVRSNRRECWGNWASDLKRDFHNARERVKTTASVEVVDFKRIVTATRDDARDVILTQVRQHADNLASACGLKVVDLLIKW